MNPFEGGILLSWETFGVIKRGWPVWLVGVVSDVGKGACVGCQGTGCG